MLCLFYRAERNYSEWSGLLVLLSLSASMSGFLGLLLILFFRIDTFLTGIFCCLNRIMVALFF